jgi:beta-glucosidase/6-phospho-beta-glucosidase/beta-galactosidase
MQLDSNTFIWAGGIENTFVPHTRRGHRALDEYELIGHYEHWRQDLALARDLGLQALRWGVPWYRVEPRQGQWDWRWTDQVIPYMVAELGITPIIDLMHYGCPLWMDQPFIDSDYPQAVAAYAGAFAKRYKDLIRWYTPLNEPFVNALMCDKRGLWPPYRRGDRGYVHLILQLAQGMLRTVEAIKSVDSAAMMVHVEAAGFNQAATEDLTMSAWEDQHRRYVSFDLLTGRVTPEHALWAWLVRHGAAPNVLADIARNAITLDLMGLNFYPRWSTQEVYMDRRGRPAYRLVEKDGSGFAALIHQYYERYQVPIMVTETSEYGSVSRRARWLDTSVAAIKQLRGEGVPVIGYTWFPLFTMIDWRYRYGQQPVEQYRVELGLYTLNNGDGQRWQPTPLAEQFRAYVRNPVEAVGVLRAVPPIIPGAVLANPR